MTAITPTTIKINEGKILRVDEKDLGKSIKIVLLDVDTTDGGATFDVTLKNYNLKNVLGIRGITHSTTNSVLVVAAPTTSVSAGVMTVTVGGTTGQKKRSFMLIGEVN